MKNTIWKYTRPKSLTRKPTHYCPGCGHGIVHKIIAECIDELDIRCRTIGVAPVGCAVLAYFYFNFDVTEAAHGRASEVAAGIKRVLPDRIVFSYQGDGDLAAIGLAETIHVANRGENISVFFINNTVYGMTGGQMAPTTLVNQKTCTTPYGRNVTSDGAPLKICELLNVLEAPFLIARVAIDGPAGIITAKKIIKKALMYQLNGLGYTFVEILSPCPTHMKKNPVEAFNFVKNEMSKIFPAGIIRDRGD